MVVVRGMFSEDCLPGGRVAITEVGADVTHGG